MSRRVLVLAADEDDALRFALGRPDMRAHHLTLVWPLDLRRVSDRYFDRLVVTAAAMRAERIERVVAACKTRIGRTSLTEGTSE